MSDKKLSLLVNFVGVDKMSATARALRGATKAASDQISAMKGQVAALNKGLADAKAMRAATENLKKHKAATKEAAEKLAMLKAEIKAGEAPTQKLVRSIQSAEKNLVKLQGAEKDSVKATKAMMANLREAGIDITRLGAFESAAAQKIDIATRALERQRRILAGNKKAMVEAMAADERASRAPAGRDNSGGRYTGRGTASGGLDKNSGKLHSVLDKGQAVLGMADQAADTGAEFEALTFRLRALGLGAKAVKELVDYAGSMNVAGSSRVDNLRYIVESQGAFRESGEHSIADQLKGAKMMAPLLARLMVTSKSLGQELSPDQERYFLRFIEQSGGMTNPQRAAELTGGLFRAIVSSGGNVDPSNYQGFLARAGTSGMRLSSRAMFADFEPLIAEMHDSAGVGLATAYSRVNGMVKNQAAMRELIRLGAWDQGKIIFNKVDGIKAFKNGENPLRPELANRLATDPVTFYMEMQKRYAAAGVKDVQRENLMLFGKTGGALFNLIDKQLPTILKSRSAYEQTVGLGEAHGLVMDGLLGSKEKWAASFDDFKLGLAESGGVLQAFTTSVGWAASALRMLNGSSGGGAPPSSFTPKPNWANARPAKGFMAPLKPMSPAGPMSPAWFKQPPAGPLTINVHAAPGQSHDAIADHVMRKIERAQGIKSRSSYDGGR